tara:strand:- start:143 stop:898 length:756 start_codon:yes stop_codon:yes gene_type:complete
MENNKKECKFCTEQTTLINAHIIPQTFVINQTKKSNIKNLVEVTKDIDKSGKVIIGNGYSDKDILCQLCDQKFGDQENKLKNFLSNSSDINKYYYRRISLAIKGILWKAHITSHQEFKHIYLGKYEKILYNSLSHSLNNPAEVPTQDFPIWLRRYKNLGNGDSKNDVILNMINCGSKGRDKFNGTLYRFDFSNHQIIIRVGGNTLPEAVNNFISNDTPNISEICYKFNNSLEDIFNPNQTILQAFNQVCLN